MCFDAFDKLLSWYSPPLPCQPCLEEQSTRHRHRHRHWQRHCAHVGKCKQPECVASRPLLGQCMLPALTADSAFRLRLRLRLRLSTLTMTPTLECDRLSVVCPMWFIGISVSLSASLQVTLPLSFSLSSLPSSMRLVSLAPFCYLNCRSISLSAFWRDAASPASHYQAGVFVHVCVRVSHSLSLLSLVLLLLALSRFESSSLYLLFFASCCCCCCFGRLI